MIQLFTNQANHWQLAKPAPLANFHARKQALPRCPALDALYLLQLLVQLPRTVVLKMLMWLEFNLKSPIVGELKQRVWENELPPHKGIGKIIVCIV